MKKILAHTLGALSLAFLIAAPAVAADTPQTPMEAPAAEAAADFLNPPLDQPIEVHGPPADLPNRGHACVLPPQQQDEDCICPTVFDPVCGCNGETYSNACFASCEVRSWSEGACSSSGC